MKPTKIDKKKLLERARLIEKLAKKFGVEKKVIIERLKDEKLIKGD